MQGCQTPLVEVLMFCCWALLPYYICDGIEWSGIVAVVAAGFVMDVNVVGQHHHHHPEEPIIVTNDHQSVGSQKRSPRERRTRQPVFSPEGHLSKEAKTHIGFVTEIIATMMETAIFAYLGLFLFNSQYHWNFYHTSIAIGGCCLSRAIMIPSLRTLANSITKILQVRANGRSQQLPQQQQQSSQPRQHNPAGVVIDKNMQLVLWFAGLRGAMSFALVENIPLFDAVTGQGTRFKSELKAMTSATIIFTVFILGGGTYYMMDVLGMAPSHTSSNKRDSNSEREMEMEMITLGRLLT
jgi:NhaP-type Na+/H+ or K+/H+ antiporter